MEIDMMKLEAKRSREHLRVSKDLLEDIRLEHTESQLRLNRVKVSFLLFFKQKTTTFFVFPFFFLLP